jgi:pyrroloquinoline quinone biosynthesis protein D
MLNPTSRPGFPRGVRLTQSDAHGGWVLMAPERVFKADAIATEILKRCDGKATVAEISADLARAFNAPLERVLTDVLSLLRGLEEKQLLQGQDERS